MTKNEIIERLLLLHLVLQYRSDDESVFSTGQRICINQERGFYMKINFPLEEDNVVYEQYKQPSHLELKISETHATIINEKWVPKQENEF